MSSPSRLEQALQLFLAARARGDDPRTLPGLHPDLADLLAPMCEEESTDVAPAVVGGTLGEFTQLREVGRGGMGVVFEARQTTLDRRVALKVLAPDLDASPTQLARFHREARTLARLDHPHVVRVLDFGCTDGKHWLAMEFVDGQSLEARLQDLRASGGHRGSSRRALVEVIAAVADALQHVHDNGVLHRDVKPSNILLHRDGHALLTDFGLARDNSAPGVTQPGVVAGTPFYMSPEHLGGGSALVPASDVFSLGATLYECVTLARAFDGPSTDHVLRDILSAEPIDPRRHDRAIPGDLAAIVLRALEKDPRQRYASARALADDLRAFLELRTVQARPPGAITRFRRFARRRPLHASLVVAAALICALALALLALWPTLQRARLAQREQAYEEAISQGDLARLAGDRDGSLRAFERARALFPERSEAPAWKCLTLAELDNPTAALRALEAEFGAHSDLEAVERARAFLLITLGRRAEAEDLERDLGTPTTPMAMMFSAATMLRRGTPADFARAAQLMSLAVRMSTQPRLFMYMAWAGVAPPEQQRECASAILALWPNVPIAMQQAAVALRDVDPARAAELMGKAIEGGLDPRVNGGHPHFLHAGLADRAGDHSTALAAARRSLALDVLDDDKRKRLIAILESGDPEVARAETETWLERSPNSAAANFVAARTRAAAKDWDGALLYSEIAALAVPPVAEFSHYHALVLARAGRFDAALEQAQRNSGVFPTHRATHELLLELHTRRSDRSGCFDELRRWVRANPGDAEAHVELARGLVGAGDASSLEEALAAVARAETLTGGSDADVLALRARIHAGLAEASSARLYGERAKTTPPKDGGTKAGATGR